MGSVSTDCQGILTGSSTTGGGGQVCKGAAGERGLGVKAQDWWGPSRTKKLVLVERLR